MTNSPGYYYSGYGDGYAFDRAEPESDDGRVRILWSVAAALGLLTFGVSFGAPIALGWVVWFSVLSAAVAGLGLLPRQSVRGWLVAAFAVTGFLAALSNWIHAEGAGWALVVIIVLNLLQAVTSVAALLLGGDAEADGNSRPDYAAYAEYAQAYQAYAAQYQQGPPPRIEAQGQATARANSAATAQARAGARGGGVRESGESLQDRYQQYSQAPPASPHLQAQAGTRSGGAVPDPGIPSYGHVSAAPAQPGEQHEESGEPSSN